MPMTTNPAATHLPGGNYFDDVRLDIGPSFATLKAWQATRTKEKPPHRSALLDRLSYYRDLTLQITRWCEILQTAGVLRGWFAEFADYWSKVVGGRPVTIFEFLLLLHDYRKRNQMTGQIEWSTPDQHVANWQNPAQLYYIFHFVRKYSLSPVRLTELKQLLKPGARVLEYGCSLAPAFRDYRAHHRYLACRWVLADIPNFPFHYAMYSYGADADVEAFALIEPDKFRAPLADVPGGFDLIIAQEVLEHLDDPLFVVGYLLGRLNPGGRILFDYIRSDGAGLDTPRALELRRATLQLLSERLVIESGRFEVGDGDIGQCVGRLKN